MHALETPACRGHHGCVNRLNWNESGSLLASGSDDRKARCPSLGGHTSPRAQQAPCRAHLQLNLP